MKKNTVQEELDEMWQSIKQSLIQEQCLSEDDLDDESIEDSINRETDDIFNDKVLLKKRLNKMKKYKVGDKITFGLNRPIKWSKNGSMDKFLGQTVTINSIYHVGTKGDGTFQFKDYDWKQFWLHEIEESHLYKTKQTINKMNTQQKNQAIHDVAKALCNANNTFTTLELKNELRKKFPHEVWNQMEISIEMMDLADLGHFDFTHNGIYRTYSATPSLQATQPKVINSSNTMVSQLIAKAQSTNSPLQNTGRISKTSAVTKPQMTTKRIGRNKALEIIQNTNGKFFSVRFEKKNGEDRLMGVQYVKGTKPDPLGYVRLKELKTQITKSVNLQTLSEIKTNNTLYKVK